MFSSAASLNNACVLFLSDTPTICKLNHPTHLSVSYFLIILISPSFAFIICKRFHKFGYLQFSNLLFIAYTGFNLTAIVFMHSESYQIATFTLLLSRFHSVND
jgi:hypothetical protein